MLKPFRTLSLADAAVSLFQDAVEAAFRQVLGIAFLDGVLVKGVLLTAGQDSRVSHGLGKTGASGWWATRVQGAAFAAFEKASDANTVTLHATSTSTVDLWFFR